MNTKLANELTGGLSKPSKMPGPGYGLPAKRCNVGSKLRLVPGSTCASCYALKGRYAFANTQIAQERRWQLVHAAGTQAADESNPWVLAMLYLIRRTKGPRYFRWHDSGDLMSQAHLELIATVARALPKWRFWLPTREASILLAAHRAGWRCPANLTIRLSAAMVDGPAPSIAADACGVRQSTVVSSADRATCPASITHTACGRCRACWDQTVPLVAYLRH